MLGKAVGGLLSAAKDVLKIVGLVLLIIGVISWAKTHPDQAHQAMSDIGNGLAKAIPVVVNGLVSIITGLVNWVVSMLPQG